MAAPSRRDRLLSVPRRKILVLCVLAVIVGLVLRLGRATALGPSLGEWEDAHRWWQDGRCERCHHDSQESTPARTKPAFHDEQFRLYSHGRQTQTLGSDPVGCPNCHEPRLCDECHDGAPTSHSFEFRDPAVGGRGAARHAVLGRLRPHGCLTCHERVESCESCHPRREIIRWFREGRDDMARWGALRVVKSWLRAEAQSRRARLLGGRDG
ncbi:MAG: hypothetical protein HY791_34430 [Deltaproteobacteria bacterium]|nr:hypothetical protein [Deltaproteobacteria bacterium]